ncbi:MAG: FprA family A-type flavoprotein [Spirochaetales bacterium]|nr:FprA family A-type flavoprotein [Spirochaetales bacterium]
MPAINVRPDIYWIGVNDRTTDLFEGMWPITKEGVSYNSYLLTDEKNVIIDLSKSLKSDDYFDQINQVTDIKKIDYVVLNHMEPDHTGVLHTLRRIAPGLTILASQKAVKMLEDYYQITENIRVVKDGEELKIGKKTLQFFQVPFVHWPETIVTYETSQKILFSCDAFGGYGAFRGSIFDDEYEDFSFYVDESLRYFVNIVSKFTRPVLNAIEKLKGIDIKIIAPSHGLVWRKNPQFIVDAYRKWAEYATSPAEAGITIVYGSMYGNTEEMMNAVAQGITGQGVPVRIFDAARTHSSYILPHLWTQQGVMVGAPTYETSLFPPVAEVLQMAALKRIRNKKAAMFGSYGWSKGALTEMKKIIEPLNWTMDMSYEFPGGLSREKLEKGKQFGADFARLIKNGR